MRTPQEMLSGHLSWRSCSATRDSFRRSSSPTAFLGCVSPQVKPPGLKRPLADHESTSGKTVEMPVESVRMPCSVHRRVYMHAWMHPQMCALEHAPWGKVHFSGFTPTRATTPTPHSVPSCSAPACVASCMYPYLYWKSSQ